MGGKCWPGEGKEDAECFRTKFMLRRQFRITKEEDWARLHRYGRTAFSPQLILKILKNRLPESRFGFSISTKTVKKATKRNRLKRQLRANIENMRTKIVPGYDVIFIIRPALQELRQAEFRDFLLKLLKKARLIEP
ncbi:MAG: ribonuclease P protein component [Patescibacteria group bacterium]